MNEKVIKIAKNTIKSVAHLGTGAVIGGVVGLAVCASSKNQVVLILKTVAGAVAGAVITTYMKNKVIDPTVDEMFAIFEDITSDEKSGKTILNCVIL